MSISNYLEAKILDAVFNNVSLAVAQAYASLHSADPGETGASEIGGTTRQVASFGAAVGGAISNDAQLAWASMPACTVTHIGLWDNVSTGNFLWGGALVAPKTINAGDTFQIGTGDLDITLD
jgi:hypothetical protein